MYFLLDVAAFYGAFPSAQSHWTWKIHHEHIHPSSWILILHGKWCCRDVSEEKANKFMWTIQCRYQVVYYWCNNIISLTPSCIQNSGPRFTVQCCHGRKKFLTEPQVHLITMVKAFSPRYRHPWPWSQGVCWASLTEEMALSNDIISGMKF